MGLVLIILGFIVAGILVFRMIGQPTVIVVPEGKRPLTYFVRHRSGRLRNRLPAWFWFGMALSVGLIIGGALVVLFR